MSTVFFTGRQEHFFRPLTHGDRECCAAVLRSLHDRVHGPNADYSQALTRELVLVVIQQVLADPRYRASALGAGRTATAEDERDYASELLRKLKEHGWIEDYKDPIDLKPTLKMTRAGKQIAQALSDLDNSRSRTRQRNMRSAKKALAAFLASQDVDELLDAYDFASRVVQDLQDDIEYFRALIGSLTREALEQKVAWSEFNDFIEKRFAREYAVRLVADSAERHRGQIVEQLELVRALDATARAAADANLLQRAAWLEGECGSRSPTLWLADRIEGMVEAACSLKLPMLRSEMSNYVRRFTSLLRQALSLDYGAESPLGRTMGWLKERPDEQRADLLDALAGRLATAEVRLVGAGVRWTVREREAEHAPLAPLVYDEASRLEAAMRRAEAEAFALSDEEVLAGLLAQMRDGRLALSQLPVHDALGALRVLHAVGAARSQEGRRWLAARRRLATFETDWFVADDYELEVDRSAAKAPASP
ncbi:Wadjet anti-phage system protein JetA family protein [Azohydromonas sediminis]|uniref:Wadjet anti-phage system protein JetA family protein n=1 Tax=Azohydromonas sediminis TaxID=2259674 RepID=UPI000E65A00C|nr:Wadjet anti-phage system protein JetA family protein [Azohydromonas sediminis]